MSQCSNILTTVIFKSQPLWEVYGLLEEDNFFGNDESFHISFFFEDDMRIRITMLRLFARLLRPVSDAVIS